MPKNLRRQINGLRGVIRRTKQFSVRRRRDVIKTVSAFCGVVGEASRTRVRVSERRLQVGGRSVGFAANGKQAIEIVTKATKGKRFFKLPPRMTLCIGREWVGGRASVARTFCISERAAIRDLMVFAYFQREVELALLTNLTAWLVQHKPRLLFAMTSKSYDGASHRLRTGVGRQRQSYADMRASIADGVACDALALLSATTRSGHSPAMCPTLKASARRLLRLRRASCASSGSRMDRLRAGLCQ